MNYKLNFEKFSSKERDTFKIKLKKVLSRRLEGLADSSMPYMSKSSFTKSIIKSNILLQNHKKHILVLLHDFFDSPHIYRSMLFSDFWEWIYFTLREAEFTTHNWYIKPHPNSSNKNIEVIKKIMKRFPYIKHIESEASNKQLIDEGINAVFSVYGSAGHEFPYLGIPVVLAGDNPHINYNFTLTPKQ